MQILKLASEAIYLMFVQFFLLCIIKLYISTTTTDGNSCSTCEKIESGCDGEHDDNDM